MANKRLDAIVYATFDHQPILIPADATTRTVLDSSGPGNNRRLSPVLGFPALTVPAGFTADGLPVGLEFMGGSSASRCSSGWRIRTSRGRIIDGLPRLRRR